MIEEKREIKVLLIEDDEGDFLLTKDLLMEMKRTKVTLKWAKTYDEALLFLERQTFDIFLIDYYLGSKNGFDFLKEARDKKIKTPAIVLTVGIDSDDDLRMAEFGAYDYLSKDDLDVFSLERSIRYSIENYELQREVSRKKDLLDLMFEALPVAVVMLNENKEIIQYNKSFLELLNVAKEEVSQKNIDAVIETYKEFEGNTYERDLDVNMREEKIWSVSSRNGSEGILLTLKGKEMPVSVRARTVKFQNGIEREYTIVSIVDINSQKKLEAKLCKTIKQVQNIVEKHAIENKDPEIMFDLMDLEMSKLENINT